MTNARVRVCLSFLLLLLVPNGLLSQAHAPAPPPPPGAKTAVCKGRVVPQLLDITAKTGIKFHHDSAPEKKYIVESMSGGVLVIDYDRDGWPDIYFTNAPTVEMAIRNQKARSALFHNNHDGTFTDVTDKAGVATPCFAMGGAVGDYNNDGWPDMAITCLGHTILYRNNGDGTFTDVTQKAGIDDPRWSTGAAFGDYDGDHNNGDGTFTEVGKQAGVSDPDGFFGLGVVFADFNNSGRPDIYVADDSTPNLLYRNEGKGKFAEIGIESGTAVSADGSEQGSMGIAVGDFNHTGRPSLYVTNFADEYNALYVNQGNYDFRDASYEAGIGLASLPWIKWGDAFADIDNDGWLDLIAVNGHVYPQVDSLPSGARYRQPKNFFLNERNGTFCDASSQGGAALQQPRVSRGLAMADLDNDGNVDFVVEDIDGEPMILHNQGMAGTHWVSFELAGTTSNRLAIGARIKLTAGGMTQTAEVQSGGSYLSQHDLRVHFGLATAAKIDAVEIRWPSGKAETLTNVAADRFYAVLEGSGIVDREKIVPMKKP